MNKERWIVLGGGFKGIMGAYLLAKKGKEVSVIDKSKKVGGVLFSEEWKGCYLDKGCHLFDNEHDELTAAVMEIMDEEVLPVKVKYASIINDQLSEKISIPDLSRFGEETSKKILFEMLECCAQVDHGAYSNVLEKIQQRHGMRASCLLKDVIKKTYCLEAEDVDVGAYDLMPYDRIKFLDDRLGNILKESKILDERIAVASQDDPMKFYRESAKDYEFRNFYPKRHGLRGFCEMAVEKLNSHNIQMFMGSNIENINVSNGEVVITYDEGKTMNTDKVFWAGPQATLGQMFGVQNNLKDYIHSVPMVLYYFLTHKDCVSDYTYVQNFNKDDLFYRASIPTNYGQDNAPKDMAYICCELTTPVGSLLWNNAEALTGQVWEELKNYNIIQGKKYVDHLVFKTPVSYQVPKIGYYDELKRILDGIPTERIIGAGSWQLTKNSITKDVLGTLATF